MGNLSLTRLHHLYILRLSNELKLIGHMHVEKAYHVCMAYLTICEGSLNIWNKRIGRSYHVFTDACFGSSPTPILGLFPEFEGDSVRARE